MAVYEKRDETITAEDFLAALADDDCEVVSLENCVIEGDVNISKAIELDANGKLPIGKPLFSFSCIFTNSASFSGARFCGDVAFDQTHFRGEADFANVLFCGRARFIHSRFCRRANFNCAHFVQNADFAGVRFCGNADFMYAELEAEVDFNGTEFGESARFLSAKFYRPATFNNVKYTPDTLVQCFNEVQPTQFYLDIQNISDGMNPHFKRYVADHQYIRAFRKEHPILAEIWRWSSDYGRSFGLWAFWSGIIVLLFALAFAYGEIWTWDSWSAVLLYFWGIAIGYGAYVLYLIFHLVWRQTGVKSRWVVVLTAVVLLFARFVIPTVDDLHFAEEKETADSLFHFVYISAVIFTTLGFSGVSAFGDITRGWVMVEVILGYIMLGGLISIFANKLARRS